MPAKYIAHNLANRDEEMEGKTISLLKFFNSLQVKFMICHFPFSAKLQKQFTLILTRSDGAHERILEHGSLKCELERCRTYNVARNNVDDG